MKGVINPERWNFYDWIVEITSKQTLLASFTGRKFIPSTLSGWIKYCSPRWKKGITQLRHMVRPCVWLENFSRGYELNATPLLYSWTPWVWISAHQVTRKLYDNFKNADLLLSTTMELLGFGSVYWIVVRIGGHSDRPTWKKKFS